MESSERKGELESLKEKTDQKLIEHDTCQENNIQTKQVKKARKDNFMKDLLNFKLSNPLMFS